MEIDLEDMIKNYENRFRELPKLIQNSFEISKENNLQARKVFNQIFKEDEETLKKHRLTKETDLKELQILEERLQELKKAEFEVSQKLLEITPIFDEKIKLAEKMKCPDVNQLDLENESLEAEITKLKFSISMHITWHIPECKILKLFDCSKINISKIKWDLAYTKGLSGKILKNNTAIPFKFSGENAANYKTCNEIWNMLDKA